MKIWTPSLLELLPESVLRDPKLRAAAQALSTELAKLSAATREVLHMPRLDELSGRILDHLAEEMHVDFYEPLHLSDAQKRELIRNSFAWHRIKGTPAAVEQIANTVFAEAVVSEWFEYGGEPYHFKILTKGYTETPDGWQTFLRMLDAAKNVRSVLDDITQDFTDHAEPLEVHAGVATAWQGHQLIGLDAPADTFITRGKIGAGLGVFGRQTVSVGLPPILIGNKRRVHVGQVLIHAGEIFIDADLRDLPRRSTMESAIADLLIADVGIVRGGELQPAIETFEKIQQAKLFAGIGVEVTGTKIFDMSRPTNPQATIHAGAALDVEGFATIGYDPTRKFEQVTKIFSGGVELHAGTIEIASETKTTVPAGERYFGVVNEAEPKVGVAISEMGTVTIGVDPNLTFETVTRFKAGAALHLTGLITIGSETKPIIKPTSPFNVEAIIEPRAGGALIEMHSVNLGLPPQIYNERHLTTIRAGSGVVVSGTITILPAGEQDIPPDIIDFLSGEYLRIYFDFPTGADKPVLLQNPRGDVLVADVKAVGDFASDAKIFRSSRAEMTTGIKRADLIRAFKLTDAKSDAAIIPVGDSLRLLFDFPTGNHHKILLHNIRPGITAGELRALGQQTAANQMLVNAYGETTTGLSHVAVVKNFVITDANADERITF